MKGMLAILVWFLPFFQAFGQEVASPKSPEWESGDALAFSQKHPEQEWNFLFTSIKGNDNNYKGFSFAKSNYSKTQYLGLSFCDLNRPEIKTTAGSFSIEREVDSEIEGYPFKDTIKIDGRQETIQKTNQYIFGLDLRFLPEKWRIKKSSIFLKNIEGGFFWGGGAEINIEVLTQKTVLYLQQENGDLNRVNVPTIPTSVSFDWGPYLIFGAFGSIGRLTAFMGIKKVFCEQNNQLSFATNIGIKF